MTTANAMVVKRKMFVIGKLKSPRCFKGVKHLPWRYRIKKNAGWIAYCSKKLVREMDTKFTKKKKLVAAIDKGKELPFFSILEAMKILDLAGQKVKRFTIIYCFAKAEISNEQQKSA